MFGNNFKHRVEKYKLQIILERGLVWGFLICALGGSTIPVIFHNQSRFSKLVEMVGGLGNAIALSASLYFRQSDEEMFQSLEKAKTHLDREYLKSELVNDANKIKVDGDRQFAGRIIDQVPEYEYPRWVETFGLHGLIPLSSSKPDFDVQLEDGTVVNVQDLPETVQYNDPRDNISDDWIKYLVAGMAHPDPEKRTDHHFKVDGPSQTGKSTLISYILFGLNQASQNHGGKLYVNLIDPKYPETNWIIEPSFTGYEQVKAGVETAFQELKRRKNVRVADKRSHKPRTVFPDYVCIVDEWDNIYSEGNGYDGKILDKNDVAAIRSQILIILKEGAAYNIRLILIGQSANRESHGFSHSQLRSTTRITLGIEALQWTKNSEFPWKDIAENLRKELTYWISKKQRCALVCPNMGVPYVAPIPKIKINAPQDANSNIPEWELIVGQWIKDLGRRPTIDELKPIVQEHTNASFSDEEIKIIINHFCGEE